MNSRVSPLSTGVVQGQFPAVPYLGLGFYQLSHTKQGWAWQERDLAGLAEAPPGKSSGSRRMQGWWFSAPTFAGHPPSFAASIKAGKPQEMREPS